MRDQLVRYVQNIEGGEKPRRVRLLASVEFRRFKAGRANELFEGRIRAGADAMDCTKLHNSSSVSSADESAAKKPGAWIS